MDWYLRMRVSDPRCMCCSSKLRKGIRLMSKRLLLLDLAASIDRIQRLQWREPQLTRARRRALAYHSSSDHPMPNFHPAVTTKTQTIVAPAKRKYTIGSTTSLTSRPSRGWLKMHIEKMTRWSTALSSLLLGVPKLSEGCNSPARCTIAFQRAWKSLTLQLWICRKSEKS